MDNSILICINMPEYKVGAKYEGIFDGKNRNCNEIIK